MRAVKTASRDLLPCQHKRESRIFRMGEEGKAKAVRSFSFNFNCQTE